MDTVLQFFEEKFGWPAADFWSVTPGKQGYALWTKEHFIFMGVTVGLCLLIGFLYMICRRGGRKAWQIVLTSLLFLTIGAGQAELLLVTKTWSTARLPLGLCALSALLCLGYTVYENDFCADSLFALGLPAALLSLCFPSWRALPLWSCAHLTAYLVPTIVAVFAVMLLFGGHLPRLKRLPLCAFAALCVGVGLYFLNPVWEANFWGLSFNPGGMPWDYFSEWFGKESYFLGIPVAAYAVWFVMYVPMSIIASCVSRARVKRRLEEALSDMPDISAWDKPAEKPQPDATEEPTATEEEPAQAEATPAAEEEPAQAEEAPAAEEKPAQAEEAPAAEVEPAQAEEAPAAEEEPAQAEEAPVTEEGPAQAEETPAAEEGPVQAEETPMTEEEPVQAEETPVTEEGPAQAEKTPVTEEEPVPTDNTESV